MVWWDWRAPKHVRLEDEDFAVLVRGGVVQKGDTKIILSDIGYKRMLELIGDAMRSPKEAPLPK